MRYKIPRNFEKKIVNRKIKKITRRSKYIILFFENKTYMLIHLGMSGVIFLENIKNKKKIHTSFYYDKDNLEKHNHIEIIFNNNFKLIYNDPRRFGFFKFIENKKLKSFFFKNLGPEPFSKKFNSLYFKNFILKKNKNIKNLLLDQNFVSGLGNIYVNEVLFFSKIHPLKVVNKLSIKEIKNMIYFIKKVLKKAIKLGGSSIKNYRDTSNNAGLFQENFQVYDRENLNCKKRGCTGLIKRTVISSRSSYFCNKCQFYC